MRIYIAFLVVVSVIAAPAIAAPSETCPAPSAPVKPSIDEAALDAYIVKGLEDWNIPGLSIAVVKNGTPVYLKGFGVRSLQGPGQVDAQTLFGMMSTTKAMTALALAMLVDEGKLDWNDPVSLHYPEFALSDPFVTRDLKVKDLLTHNSGLGNTDMLWARGDLSSDQILAKLRSVPLSYSLRDSFIYQNVMYQVAGKVIENVTGQSWENVIQTRILSAIGMDRSFPTLARMAASKDINTSQAHFVIDGKRHRIAESPVDAVPAAGAAWSTATDTAKWMAFLLNDGCVGNKRLVSSKNLNRMLRPQVMVPPEEFYPTAALTEPHWTSYGYGWFQQDYRGRFVAMHTGSMDGRTAIVGLMPDEKLGVYLFGNLDHAEFRHALMWKVFDMYTGAPDRDWSREFLTLYADLKAKADAQEAEQVKSRVPNTKPSQALTAYAGTYRNPVYGDVSVAYRNGALHFAFGPMPENSGILTHWHYDRFRSKLGDGRYGAMDLMFQTGASGKIRALRLFDDGSDAFEFIRVASQ